MKSTRPSSRRDFLKKSAASAFGFTFLPAYLTAARAAANPALPPSRRINLGCIGVGGRAAGVIPSLTSDGHAVPVALCDVDFGGSRKISDNLETWPDVARFQDFRVMLDKMGKDIDAVSVVIPDPNWSGNWMPPGWLGGRTARARRGPAPLPRRGSKNEGPCRRQTPHSRASGRRAAGRGRSGPRASGPPMAIPTRPAICK